MNFNYDQIEDRYGYSVSKDVGKTYRHCYGPKKLSTEFDEGMAYQRKDGSIRFLARTSLGELAECFSYDGGESFSDVATYLLAGQGVADPYLCLADFEAYRRAQLAAAMAYGDAAKWNEMSLRNIAASGYFSADRSIAEYAAHIWGVKPVVDGKC